MEYRDFLPQPQTTIAHQELYRHLTQRGGDSNLDCDDHNAAFFLAQAHSALQMGTCQPRLSRYD